MSTWSCSVFLRTLPHHSSPWTAIWIFFCLSQFYCDPYTGRNLPGFCSVLIPKHWEQYRGSSPGCVGWGAWGLGTSSLWSYCFDFVGRADRPLIWRMNEWRLDGKVDSVIPSCKCQNFSISKCEATNLLGQKLWKFGALFLTQAHKVLKRKAIEWVLTLFLVSLLNHLVKSLPDVFTLLVHVSQAHCKAGVVYDTRCVSNCVLCLQGTHRSVDGSEGQGLESDNEHQEHAAKLGSRSLFF